MVSFVKSGVEKVAAIQNPVANLAVFSIPVVNLIVRKIKEDAFFKTVDKGPESIAIGRQIDARNKFQRLFLHGMFCQFAATITLLAIGILFLPTAPITTVYLFRAAEVIMINMVISGMAHAYWRSKR